MGNYRGFETILITTINYLNFIKSLLKFLFKYTRSSFRNTC